MAAEIIVSGPKAEFTPFSGSLGEFLFPKMKAKQGDNVSLINADTGESITSRGFLKLSLQIAEGLKEEGLQQQDVVVLLGKNSINISAALLGVLWQGGVFATLDPSLKSFELQHMFKYYKPRFVFCELTSLDEVTKALQNVNNKARTFLLDQKTKISPPVSFYLEDILKEVDVDKFVAAPADDPENQLAFIICSSGSTGLPKGVGITHANILYIFAFMESTNNPLGDTIVLQTSHMFWISAVLGLLSFCVSGSQLVFITKMDEGNILRAIDKFKPVFTFLPPAELYAMLKHPDFKSYDLSSMKAVICGGSPLQKTTVELFKEKMGDAFICQAYGITEMSGGVASLVLGGDIFSVGTVSTGVQMKVVDPSTKLSLGPNETGELLFKSKGMMKGYVGDEEATKAAIDEQGWFRSGDLGYYTEEGHIYIVDRIKELIKCRNQQISPSEIESYILGLPGVLDVGVVGIPNENDQYHPMALVVKESSSNITEQEIIDAVKENLSSYKQLRGGVRFVESIPRTRTKKIKRPLLKELGVKLYNSAKL